MTAVKQHKAAVKAGQRACFDCFNVYSISRVFVAEQGGVTLVLVVWMYLVRLVSSQPLF